MVRFLIKKSSLSIGGNLPLTISSVIPEKNIVDGIYVVSQNVIRFEKGSEQYILFGDIVNADLVKQGIRNYPKISDIFQKIKGNYYLIKTDPEAGLLEVASSIFGIFPVYYSETSGQILISSDIFLITQQLSSSPTINKRFILEKLLFYYPLFEQTIFKEIRTLPANNIITLHNHSVRIDEYFNITQFFRSNPIPYRKHTGVLSDYFIETTKNYFPDEPFYITFTGGFDGRTLVSCALAENKEFKTFSLGSHNNDDVKIPAMNAREAGINYTPVYLDTTEYADSFLGYAKDIILSSGLMNNLLYTHFNYAARLIGNDSNFVLTGFGGSEIFRALDIRGAVTSHELVDFFEFSDDSGWIARILNSPKLKYLSVDFFKDELNALIEDLKIYQSSLDHSAGLNERIYVYLYNEVFRKVFGPTIKTMSEYMTVRNPYFDIDFNIELLKYSIAGLYSQFLVKNPVKRLKGQVLYGHIINKTSPLISKMKTGKGYRPVDLTNSSGLCNITLKYAKKHLFNKVRPVNLDNLGLISGFEKNKLFITSLIQQDQLLDYQYFNKRLLSGSYKSSLYDRDIMLLMSSYTLFKNYYNEENISTY